MYYLVGHDERDIQSKPRTCMPLNMCTNPRNQDEVMPTWFAFGVAKRGVFSTRVFCDDGKWTRG